MRILLIALWVLLSAVFSTVAEAQTIGGPQTGYVFAYFQGGWPTGGHSGVFLSYSQDGLSFEAMNNGNAVYVPPNSWGNNNSTSDEDQARDPSVVYGADGRFHMVWTTGITTRSIGYASSSDLRTWTNEKRIQVWNSSTNVDNTWAPEILYDAANANYQIIFASDLNNGDHKLYSITTSDFSSFSSPNLYYYNNATVIDAMIAQDTANNQYLMAIKDEQNGQKNIRLANASTAQGPWSTNNPVIVGPGSAIEGNVTEGPSLLKIDDTWHLYYDAYGAGYMGVATSTDPLNPSSWVNRTAEAVLPIGHHGTVFASPLNAIAFDLLPFARSDLTGDQFLDGSDWLVFSSNHLMDLSSFTPDQRALLGDLNGDSRNDFLDFRLFKNDFESMNGTGSFQTMLRSVTAVPEPSTGIAILIMGLGVLLRRRSH